MSETVPAGAREGSKGGIKKEQAERGIKRDSWVQNRTCQYAFLVEPCA